MFKLSKRIIRELEVIFENMSFRGPDELVRKNFVTQSL